MPDWPHSPVHRVHQAGTYMVTAGTYLKQPLFRGADRLRYLCETLLELAEKHAWQLQAWAVFPNHYHFVALSAAKDASLTEFTRHIHSVTAIEVNRWDQAPGGHVLLQDGDGNEGGPSSGGG